MRRASGAVLTLVALTRCAGPPPPLLSLSNPDCDRAPVVEGAVPVPFDSRTGATATLGPDSRCLRATQPGAAAATYAVFRMPEAPTPYNVTVSSQVVGHSLVSPQLLLQDDTGRVLRAVSPEAFQSNVGGLKAGLRVEGGTRFLVVVADTARLGQGVTLRLSAQQSGRFQIAAHGTIFIPVAPIGQPAQQTQQDAVMALNGLITVTASPVLLLR